jgi:inosine-uridine nucleoside N-ribohydrolase
MSQKIIIDTDPGTDDAVALMTAVLSPELELIGVTTVNGNVAVDLCTENALRVFDAIQIPIPVFEGCAYPLYATTVPDRRPGMPYRGKNANKIHGDYLDLPPSTSKKQAQHAVDWLIDTLKASDGDIILVPIGPLTNIGMAILKEPRIIPKIQELVIMGGGHEIGNRSPTAEFNIWADPEAARIVINCGRPIRLVTLDSTHRAMVSLQDCQELKKLGTGAAQAAARFTERRIAGYTDIAPMGRRDAAPVHDALAVCAILDPSVIKTVFVNVDVETRGELTDGMTVCDTHFVTGKAPNVHVALDADESKFVRMLMEILGRKTPIQAGGSS